MGPIRFFKITGIVLAIFFQTLLLTELLLYITIDKKEYEAEYAIESFFYKYRRSWYGDRYAKNNCTISEEIAPHPHLAFISRPSKNCEIPVTELGTLGNRSLDNSNSDEFKILLIGGSLASHMGMMEDSNPIEIELNKRFLAPKNKSKFKIYNGAHPAWKMPSTTLMGLMNQNEYDATIFLDGFNEFTSIFFEKNLWAPSEYVYSLATESAGVKGDFVTHARKFFAHLYTEYPIIRKTRLCNVVLKMLIAMSQKNYFNYIPYGSGKDVENLSSTYIRHISNVLSYKNSVAFFQPSALIGKKLTAEEIKSCDYMCKGNNQAIYLNYSLLVSEKAKRLKLRNFYNLTDIFNDIDHSLYYDAVHLKNSAEGSGMHLLGKVIANKFSESLSLKSK